MRDYTKIEAWKLADELTVAIYRCTRSFPREEIYALTSQTRRAAYSVPANIAEGAARESKRDYAHFLHVARGSLAEVQYFVHLAHRLEYLGEKDAAALADQSRRAFACLQGLVRAVEKEAGNTVKAATAVAGIVALALAYTASPYLSSVFGP